MNVFVTGGAGYIGSICTEELLNAGHQVTVYDNLTEGHRSAVDARAKFVFGKPETEGDILNAVKSARPDAIMHFAANALVGESMTNPKKYFHNNVVNALKLADAAVECGVKKFVFSSTCATYGPPDKIPMTEDLPQRPINPYGESKLMFEKILQWYQKIYGLEFIAFRYFNAAGASEKFGEHHRIETHLIPRVLQVVLGQLPQAEIFGTDYPTPDGTCIRDYIHIKDLAQAHILGLQAGQDRILQLGQRRRLLRARSHSDVRKGHGQKNSRRGKTAPSRRPAPTGRLRRKSHSRTGLETKIPEARRHCGHRLGLAQKASHRLSGLTRTRNSQQVPLAAPKSDAGGFAFTTGSS